ncbi:MAG: hypothetical protein K2L67_00050 [Clostridia bacterium]|nr:hypothetical protein [Clostridia bacterium]
MAKKKSKIKIGKIVTLVSALFALVAVLLMFAPAVINNDTGISYTGAQVAFGYSAKNDGLVSVSVQVLKASSYILPYAVCIGGIVFGLLAALGILPKISTFVSTGCYIAAGVLFFLAVQMTVPVSENLIETFRKTFVLAGGAIASGILSIFAGAGALSTLLIKK